VVGPGCRIEAGAHIHGSVILAGALVAEGMTMDNLVVGTSGEPVW
jgi:NDP-sugar pyrophosphorylase family protein